MGGTRLVGQGRGGTCAKCGAQLEEDAQFCIVCGEPVVRHNPVPEPYAGASGTCPQCGAPVDSDALYCVVCGARLDNAQQNPVAQPVQSCPNCGWSLEPDAMYCISCGALVQQSVVPRGNGGGYVAPEEPVVERGNEIARVGQAAPNPGVQRSSGLPITMIPAPPRRDNDDDVTVRPRLLMLTREEARTGCCKTIQVDRGESIEVNVPAGVDVNTKMDVPGYGRFDEMTGQRGPLRVSFYID